MTAFPEKGDPVTEPRGRQESSERSFPDSAEILKQDGPCRRVLPRLIGVGAGDSIRPVGGPR